MQDKRENKEKITYDQVSEALKDLGYSIHTYPDGSGCRATNSLDSIIVAKAGWANTDSYHFNSFEEFNTEFLFGIIKPDTEPDMIKNPSHYTLARAASDCFSVMQQIGLLSDHEIATAFQYLWRCNLKNQKISDLKKARWFLDKAIERYESNDK